MQTFLPYPDFWKSADCLDRQRLGKQRVEAMQILNALNGLSQGWVNHPATRMWCGFEPALTQYLRACIIAWELRGYQNTMQIPEFISATNLVYPPWIGDAAFHASHRSNLLRKDPVYYGKFGWTEPNDLPYVWPTMHHHYVTGGHANG